MPTDTLARGAGRPAVPETPCTCAALRRATRRLTQAYDLALKPAGLRLTQYSVLANLSRTGGLSITDLAQRLAMDRTTLTRNLRPLERAGWVRIAPGPDRRSRAVEITDQGRRVFEAAQPLWQDAERAFRSSLGRENAAALRRLLDAAMGSVA
jgi:DNA-binding MarR family transcriptional regulator